MWDKTKDKLRDRLLREWVLDGFFIGLAVGTIGFILFEVLQY